jgi:ABC-type multidrug transport system fused ATPase/permease subunit
MGVLVFFLELKMEQKFKLRQEAFEQASDFAQESFTGITVIKAYVREAAEALGLRIDRKRSIASRWITCATPSSSTSSSTR